MRAESERLPHRRWLLFLFFYGAFGVVEDFFGYGLGDYVVVVHFRLVVGDY
ncbi:MAG TPA: hypothetical protein VMW15_01555 [Terracidiphilus sp.]|nr:hypothetical protein [Terracidiphilus sp.]